MTTRASGTFEVRMSPQAPDEGAEGVVGISRMLIDKRFEGDLEGTSRGQMLAAGTGVAGSAGYVAIEQVTGKLGGRDGTFVLQHSGTMERGVGRLTVSVVPDSGRGELEGLSGTMEIVIEEGQHSYVFDYALGDTGTNS
ncbi:MAG: DUF3224 domain-containing protein [Pyrinomonadaceae bacterium]